MKRSHQFTTLCNCASVSLLILVASCGGGSGGRSSSTTPGNTVVTTTSPPPGTTTPPPTSPAPSISPLMIATNWEIGPTIDGRNYSSGMPLHPAQTGDGWAFDFPIEGSVHYVTYKYGSLAAKTKIVMRYRIEAEPSVQFIPPCCAQLLGVGPTMYFQQKGDDWNADGKRWWATFNAPWPIVSGEHELVIPLDGRWTSVYTMTADANPDKFIAAKNNSERIGFTFGGGDGYGHGVYATGPARFVVTDFRVE